VRKARTESFDSAFVRSELLIKRCSAYTRAPNETYEGVAKEKDFAGTGNQNNNPDSRSITPFTKYQPFAPPIYQCDQQLKE